MEPDRVGDGFRALAAIAAGRLPTGERPASDDRSMLSKE
jgi:hypothetical protein